MKVSCDGSGRSMTGAAALFEEAITWLREHYDDVDFWVERDLVWTV